jgi:hypothetical protein
MSDPLEQIRRDIEDLEVYYAERRREKDIQDSEKVARAVQKLGLSADPSASPPEIGYGGPYLYKGEYTEAEEKQLTAAVEARKKELSITGAAQSEMQAAKEERERILRLLGGGTGP